MSGGPPIGRGGHFVVPLGVGATLGAGTGVVGVADPAVEESGGGSGSTFDPVPGVAPDGEGDIARGSVTDPAPPPVDPGSGSTFDPVPGVAPDGEAETLGDAPEPPL